MKIQSIFIVVFLVFLSACSDSDVTPDNVSIQFKIKALMNNEPLILNAKNYTNASGNEFNVSQFKFYLSNLKLRNSATGEVFEEMESYHLLQPSGNDMTDVFEVQNIPTKKYDEIVFFVGVDSVKNLSIDAFGDLDPNNNMAWNWKTGYKFLLLEGNFLKTDGAQEGLVLHIGTNPNYKEIVLKTSQMNFKNATATINIHAELMTLFNGQNTIDLSEKSTIMFGETANKVAENYAYMFSLQSIDY